MVLCCVVLCCVVLCCVVSSRVALRCVDVGSTGLGLRARLKCKRGVERCAHGGSDSVGTLPTLVSLSLRARWRRQMQRLVRKPCNSTSLPRKHKRVTHRPVASTWCAISGSLVSLCVALPPTTLLFGFVVALAVFCGPSAPRMRGHDDVDPVNLAAAVSTTVPASAAVA